MPVGATADGSNVYLELEADLPTDAEPVVRLTAPCPTRQVTPHLPGSAKAADMLSPVLTVELSGGSGTGTGANGAVSADQERDNRNDLVR